jgi:sulfur relay (sulfurtransferase) complex TusBCD TusD component (DsrE family)
MECKLPNIPSDSNSVILINKYGMGNTDGALSLKLIVTYLHLLLENNYLPAAICFYTEGVKLAVDGSPVLGELKQLEDKKVRLILCSTCLNYYGLMDKIQVGIPGGMNDIIEAQWKAEKVITL